MMEEVIVTSNRTPTKLGNIAVPVQTISQKTIKQIGSQRLKDILQEQAGLYITNGFGAGVQMQGLNPDYTLILINGEPLVGRTAGVLDINRISIGNIKKIEIVKGPSSSLYGSEAMAGVINIITDNASHKEVEAGIRYGFGNPDKGWSWPAGINAFKNTDLHFKVQNKIGKTGVIISSDAFYIDGLSYRPYSTLRVPQPIWRLTQQLTLNHEINAKANVSLVARCGYDHIKQEFAVTNNGGVSNSYGREANTDINIIPSFNYSFNKNTNTSFKLYHTFYNGSQKLYFSDKPDSIYDDEFKQKLYRLENQTDKVWKNMKLTAGIGITLDQANSTRYDNVSRTKKNTITYGFAQHEWRISKNFLAIGGIRYDHNQLFAAAFSPKIALRYDLSQKLSWIGSIGRGFKAPDFRQLYLNFTNNAAGGYSVLGSIDAVSVITQMQHNGLIADIKDDFYKLSTLTPEFSTGINTGIKYKIDKNWNMEINVFRNDIEGLIDVRQVATKTNGAQIFSYINIRKAFTQGAECNINGAISQNLKISAGYQFLSTADKDELALVKSGKVYTRNSDGTSRLLTLKEYAGLPNRSKHMANLKFTYENQNGFYTTARCIYRSRWYVADSDGNGLYNTNDESAEGFLLFNFSVGKEFKKHWTLYGGMDNISNHQDANYLPNLQGRMIYTGINYKF